MTIMNIRNHKEYKVSNYLEEDGMFQVALDPVIGLQSTSIGFVDAPEGLQAISDRAWDPDELRDCVVDFMSKNGAVCR